MLKRLSAQFKDSSSDPALLVPPPGARSPASLSPRSSPSLGNVPLPSPSSPYGSSYPFPTAPPSPGRSERTVRREEEGRKSIDRPALHKTLSSLSNLLVALDDLRETSLARSKAEKRLAKAAREVASGFGEKAQGGRCDEAYEALSAAAEILEVLQDVDEGQAKLVKKEYEGVNESIGRFFKRTSKDEKAFDDMMASLNARVAKTTAAYQSVTHSTSSGRNMHAALDNLTSQHSSYMQQLSNLSYQIQQGKLGYGEAIAERREAAVKKVARVMCRLAEGEWRSDIEAVKRGGQKIGRLANAAIWVQPEMGPAVAATSSDDSREQSEIPSLGRSTSLRGPRAPSTATNDSSAPSTAPSSTARVPPLRQNPPSYRGDLLQQSTSNISTSSLPPVSPKTVPQTDNGGLRRPIPRYGSAPTVPLATEADEFGRTEMNASGTPRDATPQRQDSFVARMSAKYSSATMPGADSRADVQQNPHPTHARSDSRVSLLAKRYSSPPDATFPSQSQSNPAMPVSPPQPPAARPPHRHSHSLQYPSSGDLSPPHSVQQQASDSSPTQRQPTPRRPRAYEAAQPLPPRQPDPSFSSSFSSRTADSSGSYGRHVSGDAHPVPIGSCAGQSRQSEASPPFGSATARMQVDSGQQHPADEEGVSVWRE